MHRAHGREAGAGVLRQDSLGDSRTLVTGEVRAKSLAECWGPYAVLRKNKNVADSGR